MAAKLLIIGLDGATFDILDPLCAAGQIPNLAYLLSQGVRAELHSTTPPATLPAWSSFLCGNDPSQHGVSDIFVHTGGSYELTPANARLRRTPTFLARASEAGLRVAALGVPGTYPPEPINGICVSGFDAPGAHKAGRDAIWPPSFAPELDRLGGWRYAVFNEHDVREGRAQQASEALLADIGAKERVICSVYDREAWDVFFVHLQASDTVGHHFWHAHDARSPRHAAAPPGVNDVVAQVYARLDTTVGNLLARGHDDTQVLIVSDHGMGGASDIAVYLNRWLECEGLLRFARAATRRPTHAAGRGLHRILGRLPPAAIGWGVSLTPVSIAKPLIRLLRGASSVDHGRSLAFSDELDYAPAIWLNRRSAFAQGSLSDAQADQLASQIAHRLEDLRTPWGERLIRAVHRRETLYAGPHNNRLPDLLMEPEWPNGYRPSFLPSPGPGPVVRQLQFSELNAPKGAGVPGVHRPEGVFLLHGPGIAPRRLPPLPIAAAGRLVYELLGVDVPEDVTAAIPSALAEQLPFATQHRAQAGASAADTTSAATSLPPDETRDPAETLYTEQERLQVTERLRALGYLE